jgi:hypothetical protein
MFAWFPATEADQNPFDSLTDLLLEAASKAAVDIGYPPK